MLGKLLLVIIAIILLIAGPVITIVIMNFLLAQMFISFIPLEVNGWNWLAIFILGLGGMGLLKSN